MTQTDEFLRARIQVLLPSLGPATRLQHRRLPAGIYYVEAAILHAQATQQGGAAAAVDALVFAVPTLPRDLVAAELMPVARRSVAVPLVFLADDGDALVLERASVVIHRAHTSRGQGGPGVSPFTEAALWVVRCLLGAGLDGRHAQGFWRVDCTVGGIAVPIGLAPSTVTRALQALKQRGWIQRSKRAYALADVEGCLMALLTHQSVKPTPWIAAHCLFSEVVLPPGLRCAWSGWAALKAHGHLRTLGDPPGPRVLAYAGRAMGGDLDALGVIPAPGGEVSEHGCWIRMGTALPIMGVGQQWVDPVVAALDVARSGAQGMEQARLTMGRLAADYQPWR